MLAQKNIDMNYFKQITHDTYTLSILIKLPIILVTSE